MTRALVQTPDNTGYLINFDVLPRCGDTLHLLTVNGEDVVRLTVTEVRHILTVDPSFGGGAQIIEIDTALRVPLSQEGSEGSP